MKNEINSPVHQLSTSFWKQLEGETSYLKQLSLSGAETILPSRFNVTAFATAATSIATLAAAELQSIRSGKNIEFFKVHMDSLDACGSFKADSLFKPNGWTLPAVWDPFAGDYQSADRWIRLHTNYSYHKDAVFKVLGQFTNRDDLAKVILTKKADELEQAIFEAGGCSAVMYTRDEWKNHHHGKHILDEKLIQLNSLHRTEARFKNISKEDLPLKGIRVLDMTRVIAGPTCTKFLAAYGAEVLRLDPPNFAEVAALLPETTVGKRTAFLDIKSSEGLAIFKKLIQEAHVFVHGLRPDALEKLGIDSEFLKKINPSLIEASINAYGTKGPWKNRRGFDSLVQMSSGIAEAGAKFKQSSKPIPLPVQALDYGVGYLMAAGVCRALTTLFRDGKVTQVQGSLVGASNCLQNFVGDFEKPALDNTAFSSLLIEDKTEWGMALRVRLPGSIGGRHGEWNSPAGQLGKYKPAFATKD